MIEIGFILMALVAAAGWWEASRGSRTNSNLFNEMMKLVEESQRTSEGFKTAFDQMEAAKNGLITALYRQVEALESIEADQKRIITALEERCRLLEAK